MLQRVITKMHRLQALSHGIEPAVGTVLMQALRQGWTIPHVAASAVSETQCTTFVLEKWANGETVEGVEQRHEARPAFVVAPNLARR